MDGQIPAEIPGRHPHQLERARREKAPDRRIGGLDPRVKYLPEYGASEQELLCVLHPEGIAIIGKKKIVKPFPEGIGHWGWGDWRGYKFEDSKTNSVNRPTMIAHQEDAFPARPGRYRIERSR